MVKNKQPMVAYNSFVAQNYAKLYLNGVIEIRFLECSSAKIYRVFAAHLFAANCFVKLRRLEAF